MLTSAPNATYLTAPCDVWALGVILVNLTCGRNPWRVASTADSTFRAYLSDRDFLKTILPISEDLNEILKLVFEPDPAVRITVSSFKALIMSCFSYSVSS